VHDSIASRIVRKNFGELWSINHGDLEVELYPLSRLFWKNVFQPLGVLRSEIFTRATESPSLASFTLFLINFT